MYSTMAKAAVSRLSRGVPGREVIRMQSDTLLPEAERRGYRHVFDAFASIVREDGAAGLLAGVGPTVPAPATHAM